MAFHSLFMSPAAKMKMALDAKDENLVWQYFKRYANVLPEDLRSKLWSFLSPSANLECCPEFEDKIKSSPNYRTLSNDMERTWSIEKKEADEDQLKTLRSDLKLILVSYWKENPRVGYCQGIHSICNLIYHEMNYDLEESLCVLNGVMEELRVGGLYIHEPPLTALQHCGDLILEYLSIVDPNLYEAIDSIDFVNILAHWFMSGFVGVLAHSVVRVLFDGLIADGIIVFFAAALVILKLRRSDIIQGAKDPRAVEGSLLLGLGLASNKTIPKQHEKYFVKMVETIQEQLLVDYDFDEKIEEPLFHDDSSSFWSCSGSSHPRDVSESSSGTYVGDDSAVESSSSSSIMTRPGRASSDASEMSVADMDLSSPVPESSDMIEPIQEESLTRSPFSFGWLFRAKPASNTSE